MVKMFTRIIDVLRKTDIAMLKEVISKFALTENYLIRNDKKKCAFTFTTISFFKMNKFSFIVHQSNSWREHPE